MIFREPDNPITTTLDVAVRREFEEPKQWLAEPKGEGWRSALYKADDHFIRYSKKTNGEESKRPVPKALMDELDSLGFPKGTAFDAEWMGPCCVDHTRGAHWFILFDLLYYGGQWQGDIPYEERKANMTTLVNMHRNKAGIKAQNIIIVPYVEKGFKAYYDEQKKQPLSEGIVMKLRRGHLTAKGGDNPGWSKIKYR